MQLSIAVTEQQTAFLLPPLTLQLLVENAVKHNTIHKNKPLLIEIRSCDEKQLLISNNLQRKSKHLVISHGVGLKNIAERYKMASAAGIKVQEENDIFTVKIPLLPAKSG